MSKDSEDTFKKFI